MRSVVLVVGGVDVSIMLGVKVRMGVDRGRGVVVDAVIVVIVVAVIELS